MKKKSININDPLAEYRKKDSYVHPFPKSAQEAIDIKKVSESGIFELPDNRFSATWEFEDINYKLEDEDTKDELLYLYATRILNPLRYPFKLTIRNKKKNIQAMENEYLYPDKHDGYEELRKYVNQETLRRIKRSRKGYTQEKYLTVSAEVLKVENPDLKIKDIENDLSKGFSEIGSGINRLTGDERLKLLRDILQPSATVPMPSITSLSRKNRSFLDELVSLQGFDFSDNGNYEAFRIDRKYGVAMYAASYPDILTDEFIYNLSTFPIESIISIDGVPIPASAAQKFTNNIYQAVEDKIRKQQKIRNRNHEYSSDISETVLAEKRDTKEFMEQQRESCEKTYLCGITVILFADTRSELQSAISSIKTIGEKEGVRLEVAWMQQKESFMTALPIGNRYTENLRTMFTSDIATLCPFQAEKMKVSGTRMCYGRDRILDDVLFGNRKALTFGGGFYFGKPGTGKSFLTKWEMANILAGTDDIIICIDPTLEYKKQLSLFKGGYLNFSPGSNNSINPLHCQPDIFESEELDEFIDDTANYMLAVFNTIMPGELESGHNTIISRCVRKLYESIAALPAKKRYIPIMSDLKAVMDEQPEPQAEELSLALELFTNGAFRMFNHQTNVKMDTRFTCFGIRDVGKKLFGLAMLTISRFIDEQVNENFKKGITTWIYYDEIHELLGNKESAEYMDNSWRKHRKQNAIDTGLTHTPEEINENAVAKAMIKNSEFLFITKSSKISGEAMLQSIEGMKPEYLAFIYNAVPGFGLLKHGKQIIPIDATLDEDNPLMKIFNTDPNKYKKEPA